jgi:hypothetical protein
VESLRAFGETTQSAEVPEAKELLLHAVYDWIVVEGPTIVKARLTPAARC